MTIYATTPPAPTPNTPFEAYVLAQLHAIQGLKAPIPTLVPSTLEKHYKVEEVCKILDVHRNTLEKYFKVGLLTKLRATPNSNKIYVAESEVKALLKQSHQHD